MDQTSKSLVKPKQPGIIFAVTPIILTVALLSYQVLIVKGSPHIPLIFGIALTAFIGMLNGFSWLDIQDGISKAVATAIPVIFIFMAVGMTISTWILCGTVPLLTKFGLIILNPTIFLPVSCLVCALISVVTGTSWGTLGTIGLALLSIGESLGIPSHVSAGAIVSGAWFGDKMSPLSDTTNFASAIVGADLYAHIRNMLPTTLPAMLIAFVIYSVLGAEYGAEIMDTGGTRALEQALDQNFVLNGWVLLPPLVVLITIVRKVPALPGIFLGVITAGCIAIVVQDASPAEVFTVMMNGYESTTGDLQIDQLLSKGGIMAMMWVISLVIIAIAFGGTLETTGCLGTIVTFLLQRLRGSAKLVFGTLLVTFGFNLTSNAFVAYTVPGRMFAPAFRGLGLSSVNVSRLLEDGATMTAPLIPWNSGAIFVTATLGIPALAYAPFAFANWIAPLLDILWGATGRFMPRASEEEIQRWIARDEMIILDNRAIRASDLTTEQRAELLKT